MMKIAIVAAVAILVAGCKPEANENTSRQQEAAKRAAAEIQFTDNAEIDNIKRRITLTAKPGLLGFIILLNEAGQPIMYEGVVGKVTSGGKRLTPPDRASSGWGGGGNTVVRSASSDEGTWGGSSPYIFYWNQNGEYRQWSGQYLYSDKPFRLKVEPLVVTAAPQPN